MRHYAFSLLALLLGATAFAIDVAGPCHAGREVALDLGPTERQHNINARGLGCCVFRSIDHAARWQNVPALVGFPEWMVAKGIAGGGYPQKVDQLIPQIAKDRGLPVPEYMQYEGKDLKVLRRAVESGRMPCVTYDGRDPHYRSHIEHMVNVVHCDDEWVVVLDNNFVGDDQLVWLKPDEFLSRWCGGPGRNGWMVVLLAPGRPPVPPGAPGPTPTPPAPKPPAPTPRPRP